MAPTLPPPTSLLCPPTTLPAGTYSAATSVTTSWMFKHTGTLPLALEVSSVQKALSPDIHVTHSLTRLGALRCHLSTVTTPMHLSLF